MKYITIAALLLSTLAQTVIAQTSSTSPKVILGKEEATTKFGGSTNIFLGHTDDAYYILRIEGVGAGAGQEAILLDNPGMGIGMSMLIGFGVIEDDRRLYDLESYMGHTNANIFSKAKFLFQKYSHDCNLLLSEPLDLTYNDMTVKLKNIVLGNGKFHAFGTTYDKKNYVTTLYHTVIGMDGKMDPSWKQLDQVTGKNPAFTNIISGNAYRVKASEDRSKILVHYSLWNTKNSPEKTKVRVFDNNLNELWSHEYVPKIEGQRFVYSKDFVTDNGDVYFLAKVTATSDEKKSGSKNFRFVLVKAAKDLNALKYHEVKVADKLVTDVYLKNNPNGSIDLIGFFSEASSRKAGGVYITKLAKDFSVVTSSHKVFSAATISDILGEDEGEDKSELGNIHIRKAFLNDDGTYTLACENYQIITRYSDGRWSFGYRYFDIPLFRIKEDGSVVWATVVKKRQKSNSDGAMHLSYVVQKTGDNLQIIFNGHKEDPKRMMFDADYAVVYNVTIDSNGKQTLNKLFSSKETDYAIVPKTSYLLENSVMLYAIDGLKYRFVRVDL